VCGSVDGAGGSGGGTHRAAEGVGCSTLLQCFATYAIILPAKGVGNVVDNVEVDLGVLLPIEEAVIVEELDIGDEEWGTAFCLGCVLAWVQEEKRQYMPCWLWPWWQQIVMLWPCVGSGAGFSMVLGVPSWGWGQRLGSCQAAGLAKS